jgi:hypothetical protein
VHYAIALDTRGVEWNADRSAWEVTNDLGYRVRVTRGYLTTYSMELVECPKPAVSSAAARLFASLWSVVEPRAWAGHASGTPNPAAIRPMQVESLLAPTQHELATLTLAPQAYCQFHYLIARAGHDSPGLPTELDMVDASLHLDGAYRAPGATTETPFKFHTAVANGALLDHTGTAAAPIHVDTGTEEVRVTVVRHLAALFKGVDFVKLNERALPGQILQSFVDGVELRIERLP